LRAAVVCAVVAVDQHWYHNASGSLEILGRCLDIVGGGTAAGTKVELWDCNGGGNQVWQPQANGSLLNPASGLCLDDPADNTANGTQLQIYTCNGTPAQQFPLS
jgi:non-reducing end alpha-L-arabinofuranosidase